MNRTDITIMVKKAEKPFPSFHKVKGYNFPTVGLAVTPDINNLGFNITHTGSGLHINSIPQTKDRCFSFVRNERKVGRDWSEIKSAKDAYKWVAQFDGLSEKIQHDLCRRWSRSTARRRKESLVK